MHRLVLLELCYHSLCSSDGSCDCEIVARTFHIASHQEVLARYTSELIAYTGRRWGLVPIVQKYLIPKDIPAAVTSGVNMVAAMHVMITMEADQSAAMLS